MRLIVAGVCLALLLMSLSASPIQQQAAKGSIEGMVTLAGTGDPIPGARVSVTRTGAITPPGVPPPPLPPGRVNDFVISQYVSSLTAENARSNSIGGVGSSVITDNQGRFTIRDLDPGAYRISVGANGYAKQEYGQRTPSGLGTPVNVNSGQTISVAIPLTRAGSVSGRIRDNGGQPAVGIQVQVLKPVYNANGQRNLQPAGSSRTDDRGEYRLFWISPGRYYVMASSSPNAGAGAVISSPNEMAGDGIAPTFYPGSIDISQAASIDLKPGADIGGVDVIVNRQPSFRIRGRLIDTRNGQGPTTASITVGTPSVTGGIGISNTVQVYDPRDGSFELREVTPGPHTIRAQIPVVSNTVTPGNGGTISGAGTIVSGQVALNVMSDIDGVVINLSSGVSISGRISLEATPTPGPSGITSMAPYRVQMRAAESGVFATTTGPAPQPQGTNPDGTFRVDNVVPGEYRVSVVPLPPDFYVKEIRFNQSDALNNPMQFSGAGSGTLEVLLSSRGGRIDGSVLDDSQHGVPGTTVVLIPDRQRDRTDLYKSSMSDANGTFSLRSIAPGDYHLFAWAAIDPYAYFDSEVMKQFESQGKPVHISESAKENVDVRMIPAEP
jgi:protocatechuate 3,4-dioxygenase beta subunit